MDALSQLKVKGVVVGPLHVAPPDQAVSLRFEEISPEVGNLEQFKGFVQAAHKKGEESHDTAGSTGGTETSGHVVLQRFRDNKHNEQ